MLLPAKTAAVFLLSRLRERRSNEEQNVDRLEGKFRVEWVAEESERTPTKLGEVQSSGLEESERGPELLSASSSRNQRCALPEIGHRRFAGS